MLPAKFDWYLGHIVMRDISLFSLIMTKRRRNRRGNKLGFDNQNTRNMSWKRNYEDCEKALVLWDHSMT
jgi:hypothetical protein